MVRYVLIVLGIVIVIAAAAILAEIAGLPVSGGAIGGAVGGIVAVMLIPGRGHKACPRCGTELPQTRRPNSLKQALWGGWTCPNCGCDVSRQGREIVRAR